MGTTTSFYSLASAEFQCSAPPPSSLLLLLLLPSPLSVTSLQIGDYRYDLAAGKAAGIATVHVDVGHGEWPELTDLKIFKLDELVRALESFGE